jgi:hypothetical protein
VFFLGEKLNQKAIKTSIYIEDQAFGGIINLQEKGRGHICLPLYFPFQIGWVFNVGRSTRNTLKSSTSDEP